MEVLRHASWLLKGEGSILDKNSVQLMNRAVL